MVTMTPCSCEDARNSGIAPIERKYYNGFLKEKKDKKKVSKIELNLFVVHVGQWSPTIR